MSDEKYCEYCGKPVRKAISRTEAGSLASKVEQYKKEQKEVTQIIEKYFVGNTETTLKPEGLIRQVNDAYNTLVSRLIMVTNAARRQGFE